MNKTDQKFRKSYRQFNKIVTISLLAGILVVSSFLIFLVFNPEPGFVTFSILNEDQEMQDYPTNATIGDNISFYVGVDNNLGRNLTFNIKILKGDNITVMNETGTYNAVLNNTIGNYTINNREIWLSEKLDISFYTTGVGILIVELYEIPQIDTEKFFDLLYLRLNITS
ncbi:MAG: DUF1616 domain-containing protein [Candidatus Lokiarchaeota archaeon]|nr:DUF1616 domain-containing protein [Candidatus Lokiarchaeota archaeon]